MAVNRMGCCLHGLDMESMLAEGIYCQHHYSFFFVALGFKLRALHLLAGSLPLEPCLLPSIS
jgi:hypothetical protein